MKTINRQTTNLTEIDYAAGAAILVDKPLRWSSFKVVHEIRRVLPVRKVGHAGTLDPQATGLLILCTGKMTKSIVSFQELPKTYTGTFRLGQTTPSLDSETEVQEEKPWEHITAEALKSAAAELTGKIMQTPPMYSAVHHKGKKLYKYAHKGKVVERQPREVEVYEFEITGADGPEVYFRIKCSKGTYIRVIADDLGKLLGCGAYLGALRRTSIGEYTVDDAVTVEAFQKAMTEPVEKPPRKMES